MAKVVNANAFHSSLRRHAIVGVVSMLALFVGLGGWSAVAMVSGAVVSGGMIVVESSSKAVQHQEGGIVKAIYAKNEDVVTAGQLLVQLDGTAIAANLEVVRTQLIEALAHQSRLEAEVTGSDTLPPPLDSFGLGNDPKLAIAMKAQSQLQQARKAARDSKIAQLREQINTFKRQIDGLKRQLTAADRQLDIVTGETANLTTLREKGLVEASRINSGEREKAGLAGEQGRIEAAIASAEATILERGLQIQQISDDLNAASMTELQTVREDIAQLRQSMIAADDRLARLDIRAPQAGIVHDSNVHTVGGVVTPSETLMMIIPQDDRLTVDVRINPLDIEKVRVGQPVSIKLSGFDPRATPQLSASIRSISPDASVDTSTGVRFYYARVELDEGQAARLDGGQKLMPGMPVEAFMATGDRSVLAYLIGPMEAQLSRALREK